MIRAATDSDLGAVQTMALRFIASTDYQHRLAFSTAHVEAFVQQTIENPHAVVLVSEHKGQLVGMMAVVLFIHPLTGERTASEMAWWMDPAHRGGRDAIRMLSEAEQWAMGQGAVMFHMIAPDERTAEFYERLDYRKIETSYGRRL
ncbi:MAG: GNAT family N-acetyltransferase [Gemmatimonadaceae bacterium]|nr:GNAT family N-acetyltransferase [Gemmatimonadaceae bacterium]